MRHQQTVWIELSIIAALGMVTGCGLDDNGLSTPKSDGGAPDVRLTGTGGGIGSGGAVGTGGTLVVATGGTPGDPGMTGGASTGMAGNIGNGMTGGRLGAGGTVAATGGRIGTGGIVAIGTGGRGGVAGNLATGGARNMAGAPGSGGAVGGSGGVGGVGGVGGAANGGSGNAAGGRGGATATCGPTTCPNGCCDGNSCITGMRSRTRCGNGGIACAACANCFQCGDAGTCEVNPSSNWTVNCQSATVAATKPIGGPWDPGPGTAPDPFCEFQLNDVGQQDSEVKLDTFTPVWTQSINPRNATVTPNFLISHAGQWSVLVGDFDILNNEPICQVFPTLTAASFSAGTVRFSNNDSCISLTIQLTCAE